MAHLQWDDDGIRPPDRNRTGALIGSDDEEDDEMMRAMRESRRAFKNQQQRRMRIIEAFKTLWIKNGCDSLAPRLSVYRRFPPSEPDTWEELFRIHQDLMDGANGHSEIPEYEDHGVRLVELLLTRRSKLKEGWLDPLRAFAEGWRDAIMQL